MSTPLRKPVVRTFHLKSGQECCATLAPPNLLEFRFKGKRTREEQRKEKRKRIHLFS
jgi:hypothetical protein